MGLSSSKTTQKTNQTTNESATRTPTNPEWVTEAIKNLTAEIGDFSNINPYSLVADPTELQQLAWGQAGELWDPLESTCRHASLSIL